MDQLGVVTIEDIFSDVECELIINTFEVSPTKYRNEVASVRIGETDKLWTSHWNEIVGKLIQPRMTDVIKLWMKTLHPCCTREHWINFGWYVGRYGINDICRPHFDGILCNEIDGRHFFALAGISVSLSTLSQNNGALFFSKQNILIECIRGKGTIFPTSYTHPHEVMAAQDPRYVLLGWLYFGRGVDTSKLGNLGPPTLYVQYPYEEVHGASTSHNLF
jgi:hypothetical protein